MRKSSVWATTGLPSLYQDSGTVLPSHKTDGLFTHTYTFVFVCEREFGCNPTLTPIWLKSVKKTFLII